MDVAMESGSSSPPALSAAVAERAKGPLVYAAGHAQRGRHEEDPKTPTIDQLRKEIDRGQTGDKAPGVDPAAAPLGTDDEAGGNPPTAEQRAMEAEAQRHEDPKRPSGGGGATESIRNAEEPEGLAARLADAERPTDGGGAHESVRAGAELTERGGRVAEVLPGAEDNPDGALGDDALGSQDRPSAEP